MKSLLKRFVRDEAGTASLEFVLVFPVFFGFFLATVEAGMISVRHVMLERGVDIAVRDVRIGVMPEPDRDLLRARICDIAMIIPDCTTQLEIEMIQRDPNDWEAIPTTVRCVDRGNIDDDNSNVEGTPNNQLMFIRACVRIDPFMPTTGLGKTIVDNNQGGAAGGSYALVSRAAFVVEPFRAEGS
ncbi:MAG: TadE/TadG family type IV pilus assembly protein [Pseudomonadota bacterium]